MFDYWVLKLDASGNKVWDKTYGGSSVDDCRAVEQTFDGGYILGGYSSSSISGSKSETSKGGHDYWIIKLDASGNKIWDKTYGGSDKDKMYAIQQSKDGGYILAGHSRSGINGNKSTSNKGEEDYWVIKVDILGNKIWENTIGGSGSDVLNGLKILPNGSIIVVGWSNSSVTLNNKSQNAIGNGIIG